MHPTTLAGCIFTLWCCFLLSYAYVQMLNLLLLPPELSEPLLVMSNTVAFEAACRTAWYWFWILLPNLYCLFWIGFCHLNGWQTGWCLQRIGQARQAAQWFFLRFMNLGFHAPSDWYEAGINTSTMRPMCWSVLYSICGQWLSTKVCVGFCPP